METKEIDCKKCPYYNSYENCCDWLECDSLDCDEKLPCEGDEDD